MQEKLSGHNKEGKKPHSNSQEETTGRGASTGTGAGPRIPNSLQNETEFHDGRESGLYSPLFIRRIRMASNLWMTFSVQRYLKLLLQIECVLNISILNVHYLWTQQYL